MDQKVCMEQNHVYYLVHVTLHMPYIICNVAGQRWDMAAGPFWTIRTCVIYWDRHAGLFCCRLAIFHLFKNPHKLEKDIVDNHVDDVADVWKTQFVFYLWFNGQLINYYRLMTIKWNISWSVIWDILPAWFGSTCPVIGKSHKNINAKYLWPFILSWSLLRRQYLPSTGLKDSLNGLMRMKL